MIVQSQPGVRIHNTITRLEYKEDNSAFFKWKLCKVCLYASGDEQISGISLKESDIYAPVLKATEARLLLPLATAEGAKVIKTETKQTYQYWDMEDDVVYSIRPSDWWPEPIPEGHVFLLRKSIYGTRQATRKWHTHASTWMEDNGYEAMNSEQTIFMLVHETQWCRIHHPWSLC